MGNFKALVTKIISHTDYTSALIQISRGVSSTLRASLPSSLLSPIILSDNLMSTLKRPMS